MASVNVAQLRALVAVAETGGFGAAAVRLGVTQSAVSHSLASLELALGAAVVHRNGPVRPTPLGAGILPYARQAVAGVDAVTAIAVREAAAARGTVRMAATPTMCRGVVPGLLHEWKASYPGIDVTLFEGEDNEVAGWLAHGTADLAVVVDPLSVLPGARLLLRDDFRAVLRTDHPLAGQPHVTLEDLEDDTFLLADGGCEPYIRRLHAMNGTTFTAPPRIKGFTTLLDMVNAGIGVSIVPGATAVMLPPDTVLVPLRPTVHRELYLTGPANREWLPPVDVLVRDCASQARTPIGTTHNSALEVA